MSTTSKLGADMDDPEMNTLVIHTATAAGLRVNVDGKMLNDNYTNVMGSFPSLVRFARALLARQPAAIDKQGAEAKAAEFMVAARNAQMFQDVRELISTLTDPKANCPGRNLEAQRVLPLLDAFLGEGYTGRVLSFKRALERAESEGPEFEDGPDESGFKGPRPWNGFQDDKQPLTDHRIWEIADLVWRRKSITTDRAFELGFAHEVIAAALHEVRVASTSANVAQYRNEALSALLVDHSHAASAKDVDAVLKARDAIYSMFANVAQGAKLSVWYGSMPESNGKTNWTAILHKGDIVEGITIDRSEYPDRVRYEADRMRWMIGEIDKEPWILDYDADKHSGYVAPPAQTALTVTPAMVKAAIPWLTGLHHMRNTDAKAHIEEAIKAALTAARSASGDTK